MKLAIKGHPTRGKEVIELLEMMGGKNNLGLFGAGVSHYYITDNNSIRNHFDTPCFDFTLEEFEAKYPYKVGDKVLYLNGRKEWLEGIIDKMIWNDNNNTLTYYVSNIDGTSAGQATTMFLKHMKQKELKDYLKPGYVVEYDDGDRCVLTQDVHGRVFGIEIGKTDHWDSLDAHYDYIAAIYQINKPTNLHLLDDIDLTKVWERKEVELTMQQIADKFGIDVNQLKIKK